MAYNKPFAHFDTRLKKRLTTALTRTTTIKCGNKRIAYNMREEFYALRAAAKREKKPQHKKWKQIRFRIIYTDLQLYHEKSSDRLAALGSK